MHSGSTGTSMGSPARGRCCTDSWWEAFFLLSPVAINHLIGKWGNQTRCNHGSLRIWYDTITRKIMFSYSYPYMHWILLPIFVGTTKIKNLDQNINSLRVKLTASDLKEIRDAVPIEEVAGDRNYDSMKKASWKFADTCKRCWGFNWTRQLKWLWHVCFI